jgi:DNA-3-methyladenine glycosylase I
MSACRDWCKGDPILEAYHDYEWCKVNHDDGFQFEMLCLEGASVGLSWGTIMHKREAYRKAFHGFDIDECAAMTDDELEALLSDAGLIRNRSKIFSVRSNAVAVKKIQEEFGSFDAYLWSFVDGRQTGDGTAQTQADGHDERGQIDGHWTAAEQMPTQSDISKAMAADMKKRGISFVGPVITYSFMQSIGIVNDHMEDCEYR